MDFMRTRKLARRTLLTVALSTASFISTPDSEAIGFESAVRTSASGIQLVQYQSGQPAANNGQPNPGVTAELKRMFEENGQPMPSMNPQDLPNGQVHQTNPVRPTQRPGMPQTGVPQSNMQQTGMQQANSTSPARTQQPAKKNFLQKFLGKVSGQDKKASEAAVLPPTPPGYVEPPPAPPAGTNRTAQVQNNRPTMQGQQTMSQGRPSGGQQLQNGQQSPVNGPNRSTSNVAARPATSSKVLPRSAGQPAPPNGSSVPARTAQAGPASGPTQVVSRPTQPVPAVPAVPGKATTARRMAPPQPIAKSPQYVQPGTAPSFMSSTSAEKPAPAKPTVKPNSAASPALTIPKADDGFEDPFNESEMTADVTDSLDLDSIAQKPAATNTAAAELNRNPLTGVRLEETDAELFEADLKRTPSLPNSQSSTQVSEGKLLEAGVPVPPVEEFGNSLPAIELPAVEDLNTAAAVGTATIPDVSFPELDAQDFAESNGKQSASSDAAEVELPPVDFKESEVAPLKSVDAERLEQVAEQDRRVRQQRMIQSRAGQSGFKGFCPVELRDRRELIDTNAEFTATFGLQTYSFSSAAAKTAFEADPSRYAPAAGGSDVVLLVNSGEEQPGMLDYALWYRDRLYLFRSRETMAMFNQDPLRFANQY